ncbi:MAG: chemotaxis protein CheW [Chloroflexota bacterium]
MTGDAGLEQLVVFTIAGESYGVDISIVQGIERVPEITKVPRTSRRVEGVINLRGNVIPIVNLRTVFNMPPGEQTKESRIMVVDAKGQHIGCLVDAVTEVLRISADSVEPPSSVITSGNSDYLLGIAKLEQRMIILLDLEKVLTVEGTSKTQEDVELQELALEPVEEGDATGETQSKSNKKSKAKKGTTGNKPQEDGASSKKLSEEKVTV